MGPPNSCGAPRRPLAVYRRPGRHRQSAGGRRSSAWKWGGQTPPSARNAVAVEQAGAGRTGTGNAAGWPMGDRHRHAPAAAPIGRIKRQGASKWQGLGARVPGHNPRRPAGPCPKGGGGQSGPLSPWPERGSEKCTICVKTRRRGAGGWVAPKPPASRGGPDACVAFSPRLESRPGVPRWFHTHAVNTSQNLTDGELKTKIIIRAGRSAESQEGPKSSLWAGSRRAQRRDAACACKFGVAMRASM